MTDYAVGQEVWLYAVNGHRDPERVTVTKVGRKLVTVGDGNLALAFRIEDGSWNNRDYPHHYWIKTDDERAADAQREELLAQVRAAGIRFDRQPSTPLLEAVAEAVRRAF